MPRIRQDRSFSERLGAQEIRGRRRRSADGRDEHEVSQPLGPGRLGDPRRQAAMRCVQSGPVENADGDHHAVEPGQGSPPAGRVGDPFEDIVRIELREGIPVPAEDPHGMTPLHQSPCHMTADEAGRPDHADPHGITGAEAKTMPAGGFRVVNPASGQCRTTMSVSARPPEMPIAGMRDSEVIGLSFIPLFL